MTISIGLAEYPIHTQGIDEIFTFADKAMYRAKKASGNQIVIFQKIIS
ncbi:MAG: diguanylate cyclase [Anaerolineales bacterium]|nr:diguanylate cyclase [Anaerolineales bacterium]